MGKTDPPQDELRDKLVALSPERLAQFIGELARNDEVVAKKVELLLAPDDSPGTAKLLRKRIAGLRRRRSFVHYRDSFGFGHELSDLLDAVEEKLVRKHPATAVELLDDFLRTDGVVFEHADDSAGCLGGEYRRACELFAEAAGRLRGAPDLVLRIEALLEEDAYGVRHDLLKHAARFLNAESTYALAEKWMQRAAAAPKTSDAATFARSGLLIKVQTLAVSLGDPELYERAAFFEREAKSFPVVALNVARQFLAAKRAGEALEKLPPENAVPVHFTCEYQTILAGIYRQLDRRDDLQALQWKVFCDHPSEITGADYLETLPAAERKRAAQRMREQVHEGNYSPQQKALYFAEQKDFASAAKYIVSHPAAFDGNQYSLLLPLAEALEETHALAATLLYRALIDAILARSLSKYYHHATRYFRRLEKIANRVDAWQPAPPHLDYVAALQVAHKRKTAFWSKLVGKKKGGEK